MVEQRGGLLKSLATERQLFEVIARPYLTSLIDPEAQAWLHKLMAAAELVTIRERIASCRDPTDDKFLELAVNGRADLIVSGDGDLLALTHSATSRSSRQRPSCGASHGNGQDHRSPAADPHLCDRNEFGWVRRSQPNL